MASSAAIIRQLEAVHLAFHVGAIDRLYPSLGEDERPTAVARERMRDSAYLINMRDRIRKGVAALRKDRNLTTQERDTKIALLTADELRFLRQHIAAASWRLQSEADMSRLKAQGEDGAYWKLNPRSEHCETCERMGERWWPWGVLERINPSVTHPQCSCTLLSKAEAERAGHTILIGRHTPTVASLYELGTEARELALDYIRKGEALRENGHANDKVPAPQPRARTVSRVEKGPVPTSQDKSERNDLICELWAEQNQSQSAIARRIGLSQPRVRAILLARFGADALRKRGKAGTRHDLLAVG